MKTIAHLILLLSISCLLNAQEKTPKVLFVIVDGISADVIEKVATPNLDAISALGGYTRAYMGGKKGGYSETPTISAVGYNSLLTGTWANKHNVLDNDITAPNYNYWTLFRFVKQHRSKLKTAIFSTWQDNRTKLIGEGLPATGNIKLDYHFDGFELDTNKFPNGEDRFLKIDEHVTQETARYIREESPDLSWVYLQHTDNMGHQFGDSAQFYEAVQQMDNQMGRLWDAIRYRKEQYKEDWQIYITTDHGRNAETGKGHGGQSDRERSIWIVTNVEGNQFFKEGNPSMVDIAPTILRELDIDPKKEQKWELDGVPLTGPISLANVTAVKQEDIVYLTWDAYGKKGKLNIYIAVTNAFAKGGTDAYVIREKADLETGKTQIDVSRFPSNFYKIVLEGEHNTLNAWVVE